MNARFGGSMNGEHSGTAQKKRVEGVRECSGRRGVPDAVVVCRDGMKERKRRWAGGWVHDDISRGGR